MKNHSFLIVLFLQSRAEVSIRISLNHSELEAKVSMKLSFVTPPCYLSGFLHTIMATQTKTSCVKIYFSKEYRCLFENCQ